MPNIASDIAVIENKGLTPEEEAKEKNDLLMNLTSKVKEFIHKPATKGIYFFEKDVEYVVVENKVMIVDEQTGRIMDGRRYSDGLHQAIEAKKMKMRQQLKLLLPLLYKIILDYTSKLSGMMVQLLPRQVNFGKFISLM